jgi:hypothetical protein
MKSRIYSKSGTGPWVPFLVNPPTLYKGLNRS